MQNRRNRKYKTHMGDDANLLLHTFSIVYFTFAELVANGLICSDRLSVRLRGTNWMAATHALPLMDARRSALRKPCIGRLRFGNYMRRERSLDLLCQRSMKLGGAPVDQGTVFVAFAGGFDHSPPPQARLRQRLSTVYAARVQ
uniref:Uncharacterized protein n=1 Tax=viral metagenome TaxID=1070528 RepID=A0A6C0C004_9ZZZZ